MTEESARTNPASDESNAAAAPPIEDLFDFDEDPVDFMSAESFPASDPAPPQSDLDLSGADE
jgi:hypothetical protein